MKRTVLMLLLPLCFFATARAQITASAESGVSAENAAPVEGDTAVIQKIIDSLDLSEWQTAADDAGAQVNLKEIIFALATGTQTFDAPSVWEAVKAAFRAQWSETAGALLFLAAPALLSAVFRCLSAKASAAGFLCRLACAAFLTVWIAGLIELAGSFCASAARLNQSAYQIFAGLLALSGATAAAQALTPISALAGALITGAMSGPGIALCGAASAVAAVNGLSERARLDKLFKLIESVVGWSAGALLTAFAGLLSVQGMLSASFDNAAVRTARYAVDNLFPVVGGEVADTLDSVVSGVLLVKNAAGVAGMLAMIGVCARPILKLITSLVALRLASALIEPVADEFFTKLTDRFAGAVRLLLIVSGAAAVLLILTLGAAMRAGANLVR